ncbi:hypothetical protein K445DRAFT_34848, partial [Daldinia sp. EC12]
VPKTTEVVRGAVVNIVLKADQRTGRQVSGTVRDVLTRGDHHRGIKVRLTDGRIGRVQSMSTASSTSNNIISDGVVSGGASTSAAVPLEQTELSAYIVPSRRKGKNKNSPKQTDHPDGSAWVTCPVCGAFEGDETAVAHHVSEHF